MGFLDFLKGSGSGKKCRNCRQEFDALPVTKKVAGESHSFCSKNCSRKYRIQAKKKEKGPQMGGGMPW